MSYAVRLPHRQNLMVPAVALALGFAGATGAYVALDDGFLTDDSKSSTPATAVSNAPGGNVTSSGANEASTAAAVGGSQVQRVAGVNEASTAAAVSNAPGGDVASSSVNEASTAAAIGSSNDTSRFLAERGIVLRRSTPPSPGGPRP